jgi:hypothetical protein
VSDCALATVLTWTLSHDASAVGPLDSTSQRDRQIEPGQGRDTAKGRNGRIRSEQITLEQCRRVM